MKIESNFQTNYVFFSRLLNWFVRMGKKIVWSNFSTLYNVIVKFEICHRFEDHFQFFYVFRMNFAKIVKFMIWFFFPYLLVGFLGVISVIKIVNWKRTPCYLIVLLLESFNYFHTIERKSSVKFCVHLKLVIFIHQNKFLWKIQTYVQTLL